MDDRAMFERRGWSLGVEALELNEAGASPDQELG